MDNDYDNQDDSGGAQSWLERMTGRSMGDIRIHDSAQAGELARRLGARAFTVGRDIYVRSELVNSGTPEGKALIAHEATHAMEQSGASVSDMPLLRPQVHARSGGAASSSGGGMPIQRVAATGGAAPASLPASEAHAEAVESSAAQSASSSQSQGGSSAQGKADQQNTQASQQPNAEEIAERVYELMLQEMTIDIERGAYL